MLVDAPIKTEAKTHANPGPAMLREVAHEIGPGFAARAGTFDATDHFVAANYQELKRRRLFSAGIPAELGGMGAEYREMALFISDLARHCGSTGLAFAMHAHLVQAAVWRRRHQSAAVEPLLRRVAQEQLVLVSSGGSDWLMSSGRAEPVEGGYRITARKRFCSGVPVGDLLMTSAVDETHAEGPTVLHFALPLTAAGVKVDDNWRTLGMRGTGSSDTVIDGAFVPAAAVTLRRPQGRWHPIIHIISKIAMPLISAAYAGIAEGAAAMAREAAQKSRDRVETQLAVGALETERMAMQLQLGQMIALAETADPGPQTSNAIFAAKAVFNRAALSIVEQAGEIIGAAGFHRDYGYERLFRDIQALRFHPLRESQQQTMTGRLALGLEIED
jgi:alkylation response protein AidB-like acyl-CoA dehydrogenase